MTTLRQALLLVGSPRGSKSTSESLGTYLLNRLGEQGVETETVRLYSALKSGEGQEEMFSAIERADLLILACPLYVDGPPSAAVKAMELIARHRKASPEPKTQRLLAISNCGFPEANHNDTALAIYRCFAQEAGLEWAGGLALGGGPVVQGRALQKAGRMARNVTKSLDLAATALVEGQSVPQEVVDVMAKPLIPAWMYWLMGGLGWKIQARKQGVQGRLDARPHQV